MVSIGRDTGLDGGLRNKADEVRLDTAEVFVGHAPSSSTSSSEVEGSSIKPYMASQNQKRT